MVFRNGARRCDGPESKLVVGCRIDQRNRTVVDSGWLLSFDPGQSGIARQDRVECCGSFPSNRHNGSEPGGLFVVPSEICDSMDRDLDELVVSTLSGARERSRV